MKTFILLLLCCSAVAHGSELENVHGNANNSELSDKRQAVNRARQAFIQIRDNKEKRSLFRERLENAKLYESRLPKGFLDQLDAQIIKNGQANLQEFIVTQSALQKAIDAEWQVAVQSIENGADPEQVIKQYLAD